MKISDLIKKLESVQKKNGDLTIITRSGKNDALTHTTQVSVKRTKAYEIDQKRKIVNVLLVGNL